MECLAYYSDASGNIHSKKVLRIKYRKGTWFSYFSPEKQNVQIMESKTSAKDSIVINEFNELLIVPHNEVDLTENIVQLISAGSEVWYKRQNIEIIKKAHFFKSLTQFFQSIFFQKLKQRPTRFINRFNCFRMKFSPKVIITNTYADNEESFKKFQALKNFIPLEGFIDNPNDVAPYEGVEGILLYEPSFYFFKIKDGCTWQYQGRIITSSRYIIALAGGEAIESNDLETIERELFKYFLRFHYL